MRSISPNNSFTKRIAIVGGGAAGFFSAICAAQFAEKKGVKLDIRIFESSSTYLKKVKISGGGRCNVTHNLFEVRSLCQNYPRGQKELLSPMQRFQAKDTVEWFKNSGIELVAEKDGRMFPTSNSSDTIINCYLDLAEKHEVKLMANHIINDMNEAPSGQIELMIKDKESFLADAVLVATGSSPGGYKLAEAMGHTISERAPSLFSFKIEDNLIKDLPGLSFETSLTLTLPDKQTFRQKGPSLITHWGLSGPAILKLSAWAAREMKRSNYISVLTVNWMGDKKFTEVENFLQKIKTEDPKTLIANTYPRELPKRFWLSLLAKCEIDLEKQWANLSKKELRIIVQNLVASRFEILGKNRYKDEFVECGGVSLNEIDFKTMQSKINSRLHFAGEILDIDGITGGFNFQSAWTTGWIAAGDMVEQLK